MIMFIGWVGLLGLEEGESQLLSLLREMLISYRCWRRESVCLLTLMRAFM